jgi:hypothetical protein
MAKLGLKKGTTEKKVWKPLHYDVIRDTLAVVFHDFSYLL